MDKIVLETEFVDVYFDEANNRMTNRWKESTSNMTGEDFKNVVVKMALVVEEYKPKRILADTLLYDFLVTPDLQEWSGENYFTPAINNGLESLAFLIPSDYFTEISIQQMMDEEEALGISTRYFDNEENALSWLHE